MSETPTPPPTSRGRRWMLYAPLGLPEPNSWGYTEAVVDAAFPVLKACRGGAFFL